MIDFSSGNRQFRLTPYERVPEPEDPWFDWINVWVEFSVPVLKTEFKTSFTAGELGILKDELEKLYLSVREQKNNPFVLFNCLEKQVVLKFQKIKSRDVVIIDVMLRPEDDANSLIIKDFLGIDETYFPALLSGLDDMINWQN